MTTVLIILAIVLGVTGIVGSVVPGLPGPPLSWAGLLCAYMVGRTGQGDPMSVTLLMVWLGITILVTVLDYILPAWLTKLTGGSKYAGWGAIAGLFIGLFFTSIGAIFGTLLGAFLAELLLGDKGVFDSVKSAAGAFAGFMLTMGLKLVVCGVMMYHIIVYAL